MYGIYMMCSGYCVLCGQQLVKFKSPVGVSSRVLQRDNEATIKQRNLNAKPRKHEKTIERREARRGLQSLSRKSFTRRITDRYDDPISVSKWT